MSRKAPSNYFVPYKGILERVLEHNLEELFGGEATFSEASTGDGWLVEECSKIPKDPIKQLQRDTILVQKAITEERINQERARAQRDSARTYPDLSNYRNARSFETRIPVRTDHQRNESESLLYDRVASQPLPSSESHGSHPTRHSSIAGRYQDASRAPTYSNPHSLATPGPVNANTSTRPDGYSVRSSSRLLSSSPKDIPQTSSRHHKSQDLTQDHDSVVVETSTSMSRSAARDRRPGHSSYGNMNAKTAARDTKHVYVQADFPDIFEWRQYNLERAEHDAQMRQLKSQRDDLSADESISDEYTDEETAVPRHSRIKESKPFRQMSSTTRRHEDGYGQAGVGKIQPEPLPRSQMVKASRPREELPPEIYAVNDTLSQRRPSRYSEDGYDSPDSPPSPPDGIIGHAEVSGKETGGGQKPLKSSKEGSLVIPEGFRNPKSSSKSRHGTEAPPEAQRPASERTALIKTSSRDQGKVASKSTPKSAPRHHKDGTSRSSRPANERVKPHHGDDRPSNRYSDYEEDVVVRSNSTRRRDPEYNERRRQK